jgi:hypothetical protein
LVKPAPFEYQDLPSSNARARTRARATPVDRSGDPEPLPPAPVDFARMFLAGEAEDEQQSSLAIVLEVLYSEWPNGFRAANVAGYAARPEDATIAFRGALEHAGGGRELKIVTPTTVNWKLKAITDAPVDVGKQRLVLRYEPPGEGRHGGGLFRVKALDR